MDHVGPRFCSLPRLALAGFPAGNRVESLQIQNPMIPPAATADAPSREAVFHHKCAIHRLANRRKLVADLGCGRILCCQLDSGFESVVIRVTMI